MHSGKEGGTVQYCSYYCYEKSYEGWYVEPAPYVELWYGRQYCSCYCYEKSYEEGLVCGAGSVCRTLVCGAGSVCRTLVCGAGSVCRTLVCGAFVELWY